MGEVADALRAMIENWHGRKYESITALASKIEAETGSNVRGRLYRELKGHPSWECVGWVIAHCTPAEMSPDWRQQQLETLAGLWHAEHSKMPPGYLGRVIYRDEEIRSAVSTSADADDLVARTVLLAREREAAEEVARQQRSLVADLRDEVSTLQSEADDLSQGSVVQLRQFAADSETLVSQIRLLQGQLDTAMQASARYVEENQRFIELSEVLRRERDEAQALADHRYQEIERLRDRADETRQRLQETIDGLERRMTSLRNEFDPVSSRSFDAVQIVSPPSDAGPKITKPVFKLSRDGVLRRGDD
jgi:hypothetical protein